MNASRQRNLTEYILPLNMNGLQGRMLRVPAPSNKSREIMLVYGHHSTLERWFGLVQELNRYGGVTVPDLPGFGGMNSLYKIHEKPSINNYAAYLAAFIKLRYKQRRLTIVAEGFGFLIATRMLARYPDVARKVDLVVSLAGFTHKDDLAFSRWQKMKYQLFCQVASGQLGSLLVRGFYLPFFVMPEYRSGRSQRRARQLEATTFPAPARAQTDLWRRTHLRTHFATISAGLVVDNCQWRLAVPLWQAEMSESTQLRAHFVEQHLKVAYETCHFAKIKAGSRKLYDASPRAAAILLPPGIRRALSRS